LKLVYATDLHGRRHLFRSLARLLRRERPDGLLLGGDLLPSFRWPLEQLRELTGTGLAASGRQPGPPRGALSSALLHRLRSLAYRVSFHDQARFTTSFLLPWLAEQAVPCFLLRGNHCWEGSAGRILRRLTQREGVFLPEEGPCALPDGTPLLGCGYVPLSHTRQKDWELRDLSDEPMPQRPEFVWISEGDAPRRVRFPRWCAQRPSLQQHLAALPIPERPWILLAHCAPHGSALDRDHLNGGRHMGSRAMRSFIERRRPLLSLHGHFHRSHEHSGRWWERMGATIAVQPGQSYRALHACVFDTRDIQGCLRHSALS